MAQKNLKPIKTWSVHTAREMDSVRSRYQKNLGNMPKNWSRNTCDQNKLELFQQKNIEKNIRMLLKKQEKFLANLQKQGDKQVETWADLVLSGQVL